MLKRIITAVVAVAAFIPICFFSDTLAFPIAMAALSSCAVFEMLRCIKVERIEIGMISVILGAASPILARFADDSHLYVSVFCASSFFLLIIILADAVFSKGKYDIKDASVTFVSVFYVVGSFTSVVLLRDSAYGHALYLLAFIGPWVSDSAAYFCGRAFGKHKLIPDVSPNKTVEGSVGAVIFTGAVFAVYSFVVSKFFVKEFKPLYLPLIAMGMVVSVVSQIGDLVASLIKRKYEIKDYGRIFPGHGGVMDRFDSVLTTSPLLLLAAELAAVTGIFQI